jgi:DNA (cytosine-5)-methyltransferase 1
VSGLIVDMFAGGGGASLGIERALGRSPDIAVNHDPEAIAMHAANHPETRHYLEGVWTVDPVKACDGRPVDLAWFSPNCTHFSRAKGCKPLDRGNRALSWVVVRWAKAVRPRVICVENVSEWLKWGPLDADDRPRADRVGFTWRRWVRELTKLGYRCAHWRLRACDYGAPTTRERVYFVASLDADPVCPAPTHAAPGGLLGLQSWRTAAEIIDWSIPCPSIFDRARPLADATLRRIAAGTMRHVVDAAEPFIVPLTHDGHRGRRLSEPAQTVTGAHRGELALVVPSLIQTSYGERDGQAPRVLDLNRPLGTAVAGCQKHALVVARVAAFLAQNYGGPNGNSNAGIGMRSPAGTVTTQDHHALVTAALGGPDRRREVKAFLTTYYGNGEQQCGDLRKPLHTVTPRDRFGLVTVDDIYDIAMRLLVPRELARANGMPDSYVLDPVYNGKRLSKTAQIRMIGNQVCPDVAEAVVRANVADLAVARRSA